MVKSVAYPSAYRIQKLKKSTGEMGGLEQELHRLSAENKQLKGLLK